MGGEDGPPGRTGSTGRRAAGLRVRSRRGPGGQGRTSGGRAAPGRPARRGAPRCDRRRARWPARWPPGRRRGDRGPRRRPRARGARGRAAGRPGAGRRAAGSPARPRARATCSRTASERSDRSAATSGADRGGQRHRAARGGLADVAELAGRQRPHGLLRGAQRPHERRDDARVGELGERPHQAQPAGLAEGGGHDGVDRRRLAELAQGPRGALARAGVGIREPVEQRGRLRRRRRLDEERALGLDGRVRGRGVVMRGPKRGTGPHRHGTRGASAAMRSFGA